MGWEMSLRALLSLVLVLGLIAGAGYVVRRFGLQGGMILKKGARRRLAVIEQLTIDNRRRLLLIKKDDTEMLLLVGGATDLHLDSRPAELFKLPEGDAA
jgi:flagellar protein FliO/FliZ